jgi:hypothetical protein
VNWAAIWTAFTSSLTSVKEWTAQMRAVLWFVLVVAILAALLIVLPRYDCKTLGFATACDSIERGYRP